MTAPTARLRKAAHWYAARAWPVLPIHSPRNDGCSCLNPECAHPAKHPRTEHGINDATTNSTIIARWWDRWPTANVAILTGAVSGLVVLDIDARHGGEASLAELEREHDYLPETPRVKTGGGGWHYYFAHPGGEVRSRCGIRPGLDVRADRASIIAPPSLHLSRNTYEWQAWPHTIPFAPVPGWLSAIINPPPPPPRPAPKPLTGDVAPYVAAAVSAELCAVESAPEGQRNDQLNRSAFAVAQFVGAGAVPEDWARDQLEDKARAVGLQAIEARRTIESAFRVGLAHPRELPR